MIGCMRETEQHNTRVSLTVRGFLIPTLNDIYRRIVTVTGFID